ncbi:LysE/ArgO family amino acid transporter [Salinicoccus hispanicus]|uniref:LysE family transporter n=1 Tax=Salinicoccus hispanicus TaxID=157225 RepID=A0A6N8U2S2_9STAP|nr:LysE family transporter [Salinicoccus hispanicus]MXQ49969.1 LysE family transporter [Salinicoccus hispanicus]
MFEAIVHGFILALGLILPLGAQNVFIFNQGANHQSFRMTLPVVITAGLCDTILITVAVLGISVILLSFPTLQLVLFIIGLAFLLYMAWSLWHEKPGNLDSHRTMGTLKQISFAFSVSILNPHAIMDIVGVIGTSATAYSGFDKVAFTLTTIVVSWIWFIGLAIAGKTVGRIDTSGKYLVMLNKVSSIIILIVAGIIVKNIIELIW